MRQLKLFRWAAALTLALALVPARASAQEPDTVTITGTFTMDWVDETVGVDLAEIFADGGEYTWTLTLHGVSYSHWTSTFFVVHRFTDVHATSFELEFSGPQADALNALMSDQLAGGSVSLQLRNAYGTRWPPHKQEIGNFQFSTMMLWIDSPEWPGISFWAGHEMFGIFDPFPANADGYPVVESEPFVFGVEGPVIIDDRPGNGGYVWCDWSEAAIFGDTGSPEPAGDFNHDGIVDAADYVVWRKTGGQHQQFDEWRDNFGATTAGAAAVARSVSHPAVPEPASGILVAIAGFGIAGPTTIIRRRASTCG